MVGHLLDATSSLRRKRLRRIGQGAFDAAVAGRVEASDAEFDAVDGSGGADPRLVALLGNVSGPEAADDGDGAVSKFAPRSRRLPGGDPLPVDDLGRRCGLRRRRRWRWLISGVGDDPTRRRRRLGSQQRARNAVAQQPPDPRDCLQLSQGLDGRQRENPGTELN